MAWVVEDGTGVPGANTYLDPADITAYALARGQSIQQPYVDSNTQKAMDYLENMFYQGWKVEQLQSLQWPRNDIYIDTYYVPPTTIPKELKNALCELVMAFDVGIDTSAAITKDDNVIEKTMTPFSIKYAANGVTSPILIRVNNWLSKLLADGGQMGHFTIERSYG